METLSDILSLVCGQGRCFVIDGQTLPVCQRCCGLYVGAAVTGIWLAASGLWRLGLPGRNVLIVHLAMLAAALLGGLHVIDPGPRWRLLCGLWTGHVVTFWLLAGAWQLSKRRRRFTSRKAWRMRDQLLALAAAPVLAAIAAAFEPLKSLGLIFWTASVATGAVVFIAVIVAPGVGFVASLRCRLQRSLLPHCDHDRSGIDGSAVRRVVPGRQ